MMRIFEGRALKTVLGLIGLVVFSIDGIPASAQQTTARTLTIDDVLDIQRIDHAVLSPDGEWVAAVVQRPARAGEVYGRNAYEIDPSRSDVVLVSTRTGERRPITDGAADAAGYWCATWSPDGRRLAMLSTQRTADEPRGGDNVRVYVWDRSSGRITRATQHGVPTQMRYGGPWETLDLRGGANQSTSPQQCSPGHENAPFLWLDDDRLLVATLPEGEISALLDRYARPSRTAGEAFRDIRDGTLATGRVVGSGAARVASDADANRAILMTIDLANGRTDRIASIPTHPFRGKLTVAVAPDGRSLAVLASVGMFQPQDGRTHPHGYDDRWLMDQRVGFVALAPGSDMRWADLSGQSRHPLELHQWSPDSRHVALRTRGDPFSDATSLSVVSARNGRVVHATSPQRDSNRHDDLFSVLWADARRIVARLPGSEDNRREDWWLIDLNGRRSNLTTGLASPPTGFDRAPDGRLFATMPDAILRLDPDRRMLAPLAMLDENAVLIRPRDRGRPTDHFLAARFVDGRQRLRTISTTGTVGPEFDAPGQRPVDFSPATGTVLFYSRTGSGDTLSSATPGVGTRRDLIQLNGHLSARAWGETKLIDYPGSKDQARKAAVILPPDYVPDRRYPTLFWVYRGYEVRSLEHEPMIDGYMAGIYNLHLYAARGYVVVIPSIPRPSPAAHAEAYAQMADDVVPAIDALVAQGITDPDRVGVFGQSGGGYTVAALLAQTDRFGAGVAIAGITDLASAAGEFDATAMGYPGIEHEKSVNLRINEQFGRTAPPAKDPGGYALVSPMTHVDRVNAPLLLLHGDLDMRGTTAQSERFFHALYTAGKTAQLVRYGGESHSLAQSPANVRDAHARIIDWFDTHLRP